MAWLVIGGLVLISMSVFLGGNDLWSAQKVWHYFNPYYWPLWYAVNFWLIFIGLLAASLLRNWSTFCKNTPLERYQIFAWAFTFIAVFIVFFINSTLLSASRIYLGRFVFYTRDFFYDDIYKAFYVGPLVEFMSGTITWRLIITPATGLLFIFCLLRFASKKKRKVP